MKRILFLAAVLSAAPVFAQNPPPAPTQPIVPGTPAVKEVATPTFRAKEVLGSKVFITGDTGIGIIEDLVFDDAGNLEYMIVNDAGKLITAPWEAAKYNAEKKVTTLPITVETYKTIPTYTVTTYPSFYTPTYRTEVYKVYGLTPRELRKIERRR